MTHFKSLSILLGLGLFIGLVITVLFRVTVEGGQEVVLTAKPILFGKEGVLPEPVSAGSAWRSPTTSVHKYLITPIRMDEALNDIVSSDKIPVDFNAYITLQIKAGQSPSLHEKFGAYWYKNNVEDVFRTEVRTFAKGLTGSDLISDADSILEGQQIIEAKMQAYINELELPVSVKRVIIGKAKPNQALQEEIDRTAAQSQRAKTETNRKLAEESRLSAEQAKARADRGYIDSSQMNIEQYLRLRALEIEKDKIELVKNNPNAKILLMSGAAGAGVVPTYDVKE